MKYSFANPNNNSSKIPLNFSISEFSDKKGSIDNISSIGIGLPSSTWQVTQIELNFSNIEYYMRAINTIEAISTGNNLFLYKHGLKGLGVQIILNTSTVIYGAYVKLNISQPHPMDNISIQILGYNSSINAPNSFIYGDVGLNYTVTEGWNYQKFTSPIALPKGNYFLVMVGDIQAGARYHWNYNSINPNNPELYTSENDGLGWINGTQGSPFLYKLDQEITERDIYPEKYNMTAEINGQAYKILNNTYSGSGYLKVSGIDFCPNDPMLNIPIETNRFLFDLNYNTKLKNQFLSNAFVTVSEEEDNFWEIFPNISRCNYNYSIKIQLPNNWYDLSVLKDDTEIITSEDIVINGNFLNILNNIITEGANWEITAKSLKKNFLIGLIGGTDFEVGRVLNFSVTPPIKEGTFTFKLYNGHGAEMHTITLPATSDNIIYSYKLSKDAPPGNWTAYVYWNNLYDAGIQSQVFTIKKQANSRPNNPGLNPFIIILSIVIGGGSVGSVATYQLAKRTKRRNVLKLKSLSDKFKDILNLNYLMISDVKSGVNIYEKFFMGKFMDPTLISGFLEAISNFGIELTGAYRKSETISLDYEDSIILMNESSDFRIIIVMSEKPSQDFTYSITNLAKDIEEKYGALIRKFKGGDITQFAGIYDLIEMHLSASFASPLRIVMPKKINLNAAEKSVVQKAIEVMEQTNLNYFYSTFLMPDQKFNLETTKIIFNLINNKIFIPIDLDLNS